MEDFVSFEIAKRLKEKGFPQRPDYFNTISYYNWDGLRRIHTLSNASVRFNPDISRENIYFAPTISQILKWLREYHATHIEISLGRNGWYFEIVQYEYYEEEKEYDCKLITTSVINDTYEQAAIAGIEYALDNLI